MTTDSPVATKFVAAPDHWSRDGGGIRAIVIHHAEGGGTVSWLTRNDGNSSHYVVEYTGRVVQMVAESRGAGSMNPRSTRTTNDPPFTFLGETIVYGRKALDAAGISSDPNRYSIAIEVEGFAKDGPNPAQRDALRRLVADIRRRRGALPCLGHRDQQDYKACPGKKIPWVDYGGHAVKTSTSVPAGDEPMKSFAVPEQFTIMKVKDLAWLYSDSSLAANPDNIRLTPSRELAYIGRVNADVLIVAYEPATSDDNASSRAMYVKATDIESRRLATLPPDPAALEKARSEGYADAKRKAAIAVAGI